MFAFYVQGFIFYDILDKQICRKWIGKLVEINTLDPVVKKNRNGFFKYMLQILRKAVKDSAYTINIDGVSVFNRLLVLLTPFSSTGTFFTTLSYSIPALRFLG